MTLNISGLRITAPLVAPQATQSVSRDNAATASVRVIPSTTVSLGQTARNADPSLYTARGTLASSATRYALEQDSTDKLNIALLTGVQSAANNARFQGVGAALLEQLVLKGGQNVSQSVFTYADGTQPSTEALKLQADKLRQEPTNAISLSLTTASGATVRLSLASSDEGLAVSAEVLDGELDSRQLSGLADLAGSFQAAINGLTEEPPKLKLGSLVKLDPALFSSLKMDARLQTASGEPQTFALNISDSARSLNVNGPSGNLELNLDTRDASLLGNASQRQAAVRNYLGQFDAAQARGKGDKELMGLFKDAFVQLNGADDDRASDTGGKVLTGNDRVLLSGLADFTAKVGKAEQTVNPLRLTETDRFDYEVSQTTKVNGTALSSRSVQQDQQSRLSAAWHEGLNPLVPLALGTDFKSQNYRYHEIDDRASSSTRLAYNKDNKLVEASASQQASQNERVRTYVDGVLSDDVNTPRSTAQSRNLLGLIDGAFQRERTSLRERGVSILEAELASKRESWLLQADPSGIRR
ncbi:hypothetical protein [Pseudomonas japonica]|uniref:Lactate dehydrogenase n=1 Tax=Pseudomonas japonica TaxID=256466 RepID=A0A239ELC7_9PSED|nr:hypothetical protein [Pseudomonas japonica]SNS45068.1 hypothetical protein SAMN05444352_10842 [Pseudomonas japonica]